MSSRQIVRRRLSRFALATACVGFLAACDDRGDLSGRSLSPIPNDTLALMAQKGVARDAPVLIRTYKQEAELELWKQKPDGTYVYLKTFPMCRWSGQLGPKLREGDRQVPEGFYAIAPGQMNPNSHYYLSFNVGYPNAYDRTQGATGGDIMVHGICSSAGCFSMTNEQIGEIYAIAREAFNGGQRAIQMQSFPFKMTAENLAKHRLDPHIAFWKMLKEGADNFEVTKREPEVGVCAKHYVFNATSEGGARLDPYSPCPALAQDGEVQSLVAEKQKKDEAEVASLVARGVQPIELVYADGGQNPVFYNRVADVSAPEGLTSGPREIVLDNTGKPVRSPAVEVASRASQGLVAAKSSAPAGPVLASNATATSRGGQPFYARLLGLGSDTAPTASVAVNEPTAPTPADVPLPPRRPGSVHMLAAAERSTIAPQTEAPATAVDAASSATVASGLPFYERWLGLAPDTSSQVPVSEPAAPEPADVPLPPKRQATLGKTGPQARLEPGASPAGGVAYGEP